MQAAANSIRLEIQKIKNLPPLPVIAQQLLGVLNDEYCNIDKIAAIIKQDPLLTMRLLGLANSSFFGFSRKVHNIEEAIINVLGLDLVRGLAITMVIGGSFDIRKCKDFDISRHWCSALLTADLAMRVAAIERSKEPYQNNHLFLYGLLHNMGILIMVHRFPKIMGEIFTVAKKHPERRLIYTEQAILDMDHHQAGAWLAEKWQLPNDIVTVIKKHHYTDYRGEYWQEAMTIGLCSRITRSWILKGETLLADEKEILNILGIEENMLKQVADKSRSKLDEINATAQQMATN